MVLPIVIKIDAGAYLTQTVPIFLSRQQPEIIVDEDGLRSYLGTAIDEVKTYQIQVEGGDHEFLVFKWISDWAEGRSNVTVRLGGDAHPQVLGACVLARPGLRVVAVVSPVGRVDEMLVVSSKEPDKGFAVMSAVNLALDAGATLTGIVSALRMVYAGNESAVAAADLLEEICVEREFPGQQTTGTVVPVPAQAG